jgi:UDP-glucuronate decarboxylase
MIPENNLIIREDLKNIISYNLPWQKLKNKNILITGGTGFLGSYITKSLLSANIYHNLNLKIICIFRDSSSLKFRFNNIINNKNITLIHHDINRPLPKRFLNSDFVIHCASHASPKYYYLDPVGTLMPNSIGTSILLDYAVKRKVEKFLFFSSAEIYGNIFTHKKQLKEDFRGYLDPTSLRSSYSESKRFGETLCFAYSKQFNLHTNIVRPFHTYGPGFLLDDGRVFADFVSDVVKKRDILIKGDGKDKRCFCYISDATVGFLRVLLDGVSSEAYNVGNPSGEISMKDLAKLISNLFPERKIKIRFLKSKNKKNLKSPYTRVLPSIEKIKKIGWAPVISLEKGFTKTIESFIL